MKINIYQHHGYKDRNDYLWHLGDEHGVDYSTVMALAGMLGPEEDFDGLVVALEDCADFQASEEGI